MPHGDFFTQWVDYRMPVERASDLVTFDESRLIDRAAGELVPAASTSRGFNPVRQVATG